MVTEAELLAAVDAAFARTAAGLAGWPDPHPDRQVADEEYSRVTNPAKWRILGARVDAWLVALDEAGLAGVEHDVEVRWPAGFDVTTADRVAPRAADALAFVVGRTQIDEVDDAGVVLGVGDPTVVVGQFPDCGCDACDSGSQDELDEVDRHLRSIITGRLRHLSQGSREITAMIDRCSATGVRRIDVDAILADPQGWNELSGRSWLGGLRGSGA